MRKPRCDLHERWMLRVRASAHAAAERRVDQLAIEAVLELHEPGPPLGVARARRHVDGLVARDADIALRDHDGECRDDREDPADVFRFHWRASAAKQISRSGDTALATNVTSAMPAVVASSNRTQPSSTPGLTWVLAVPTDTTSSPGVRISRRLNTSARPT